MSESNGRPSLLTASNGGGTDDDDGSVGSKSMSSIRILAASARHLSRSAGDLTIGFRNQATSNEPDGARSISGRLGGHFDSARTSEMPSEIELPTEETRLVMASPGAASAAGDGGAKGDGDGGPPPLARWILPALICALAYAFYNIFIKKGSATINPILGGVILQFVAALLGTGLLFSLMLTGGLKLQYDGDGLFWSIMAGLAVGLAEMLSFVVSGLGVPATQSIPVIIGGSVMFGAVKGLIILGEKMMGQGWAGVALLVAGIAFVALDPGEKVEEGGGVSEAVEGSPPGYWIAIALVCASAYAFYNIFIKKGSASINPILGGVVLQFVAAIFGTTLLAAIMIKDGGASGLDYDHAGLFWACMAGVAVGAAEMLSFCVSGMGVNATQSIPIIIGGSVLFGAVLGLLMLGETMMWPGWLGVALLTTGIGLVATDPGEKVVGH